MGRFYYDAKTTVEQATQLSIFKLKEFGLLRKSGYAASTLTWTHQLSGRKNSIGISANTIDEPYVQVNYTLTDQQTDRKKNHNYKIPLTTTPCHFGGVRYWFLCPNSTGGSSCNRRTGTLYLPPGGAYFGCRTCYNLSYESRNESHYGYFGQWAHLLKTKRKYDDLYQQVKRRTYKGRLTRKAQKLRLLNAKMDAYQSH